MPRLSNEFLPKDDPRREEYQTKLALIGVFLTIFATFASMRANRGRHKKKLDFSTLDLAMLGVSTFRLGRMAAFDKVFEPVRRPFTETVPDETGAGMTVEPRGAGVRKSLGELISCPICAGTWISAGLVYALHLLPGPTRMFMTIMTSIGFAEFLNSLAEAFSWMGHAARKFSGNGENTRSS